MKFLGIHFGSHDANFTITNGSVIKYYKLERILGKKQFGFKRLESMFLFIKKYKGIDINSFDAIATNFVNPFPVTDEYVEYKYPGIPVPIYDVQHHNAHRLSLWPLFKEKNVDDMISFVLDAKAGFRIVSVYKSNLLHDVIDTQHISFGAVLNKIAERWQMKYPWRCAGKLMALQSYGKIIPSLVDDLSDLDMNNFIRILNTLPNKPDIDWLRTIHEACINVIFKYFQSNANSTDQITFSGGIGQSIILNSKLKEWNSSLQVPPHCGDEGISLGLVEFLRIMYKQPYFDNSGFPYWQDDDIGTASSTTVKKVAELLAAGKIIGWAQGAGEIGPRALGHRSILMRADIASGRNKINKEIKHRELYRPFGCSVLNDEMSQHFAYELESPYMLYSIPLTDTKKFSSIAHVDGTSRVQTVKDGVFAELLHEVKKLTGTSLVLNTSLNINTYPIASNPSHCNVAGLDAICVGDSLKIN
jgi:carbamoyltransferase